MAQEPNKEKKQEEVVTIPTEVQEDIKDREERSKEKADYFLTSTQRGYHMTPGDLFQENYNPEDFTIKDKDVYWDNEKIRTSYEENGLTKEDFEKDYSKALSDYNEFDSINSNILNVTTRRAADNYWSKSLGVDTWRQPFRKKTLYDTDYFKEHTFKEWAVDILGVWDPEKNIYTKEGLDSSWNYIFDDPMRVARHIDNEGNFQFKGSPSGLPYIERFDSSEEATLQDQTLSAFNMGMWKDTAWDGNKMEESILSTAVRNAHKFIPYARVVPFAFSVVEGVNALVKSANDLAGQNEELDKATNKLENFMNKFKLEATEKEKASLLNPHSLISGVAEIFTQLPGMKAFHRGGTYLSDWLRGVQKTGYIMKGGQKIYVGSSLGNKIGATLSMTSMGAAASADSAKLADAYDIPKEHAALAHFAIFAGLSSVAAISEKTLKALGAYPEQATTVYRKSYENFIKKLVEKKGKDVINPKNLKGLMRMGAQAANRTAHALREMGKYMDSNPGAARAFYASIFEGIEEVTEDSWEEGVKQAYNLFFADESAKYKKGKFEEFNIKEFAKRAGVSGLFGAIGGGLAATKIGGLMLGTDNNFEETSTMSAAAMTPEGRKIMDKLVKNTKEGSTELSMVKDKNGDYLPVVADSSDPLRKISQRDFIKAATQSKWEFIKMMADAKLGKDWDQTLEFMFQNFMPVKETLIYDSIHESLNEYTQKSIELQNLREQLKGATTDEAATNAIQTQIDKVTEELKQLDEKVNDLKSGKYADAYLQEALFQFNPHINILSNTPDSGEALAVVNAANLVFSEKLEKEKERIDQINTDREIRSKRILQSSTIEEAYDVIKDNPSHPITTQARKHLSRLIEEQKRAIALNVANYIISTSGNTKYIGTIPDENGNLTEVEWSPQEYADYLYEDSAGNIDNLVGFYPEGETIPKSDAKAIEEAKDMAKKLSSEFINNIPLKAAISELDILLKDEAGISILEDLKAEELAAKEVGYTSPGLSALREKIVGKINQLLVLTQINEKTNKFQEVNKDKLQGSKPFTVLENTDTKDVTKTLNKLYEGLRNLEYWQSLSNSNSQNPMAVINLISSELVSDHAKYLSTALFSLFPDSQHEEFVDSMAETLDVIFELDKQLKDMGESLEDIDPAEFDAIFTQKFKVITEVETAIYEYFNDLTSDQQKELIGLVYKDIPTDDLYTSNNISYLLTILRKNSAEFAGDMLTLINESEGFDEKKSAATLEQQNGIRQLISKIKYNVEADSGNTKEILDYLEKRISSAAGFSVKYTMYIDGSWGSGKTEYMAGPSANIMMKYLRPKGMSRVIVAGNTTRQASKIQQAIESWGVEAVLEASGTGTFDETLDDLKENGIKSYNDVAAIYADEGTFISESDLKSFMSTIESINDYRKTKDIPPLHLVLLGDSKQEGNISISKGGTINTKDNIKGIPYIERTASLTHQQRASYKPLRDFLSAIRNWGNNLARLENKSPTLNSNYGFDENGNIAGVNIVNIPQTSYGVTDMDYISKKKEALKEVLKHTSNKSWIYITDKDISSPDIVELLKDPELSGIEDRIRTPKQAQGSEVDIAIVDLYTTQPPSKKSLSEERFLATRVGMVSSRPSQFLLFFDNSPKGSRNWIEAEGLTDQKIIESKISEDLYEDFRTRTKNHLEQVAKITNPEEEGSVKNPLTNSKNERTREEANRIYNEVFRGEREDTPQLRKEFKNQFDEELAELTEVANKILDSIDENEDLSIENKMDQSFISNVFKQQLEEYLNNNPDTLISNMDIIHLQNELGLVNSIFDIAKKYAEEYKKQQEEKGKGGNGSDGLDLKSKTSVAKLLSEFNDDGVLPLFTWVVRNIDGLNRSVSDMHEIKKDVFFNRQGIGNNYKVVLKLGHIKDFLEHQGSVQFFDYEALLEKEGITEEIPYLELQYGPNTENKILLGSFPYFTDERANVESYGNIIRLVKTLNSPEVRSVLRGDSKSDNPIEWPGVDITKVFNETKNVENFGIGNLYTSKDKDGKPVTITLDELKELHKEGNETGRPTIHIGKKVFGMNQPSVDELVNLGILSEEYRGMSEDAIPKKVINAARKDAKDSTFVLYSYDEAELNRVENSLMKGEPLESRKNRRVGILYLHTQGHNIIDAAKLFLEYEKDTFERHRGKNTLSKFSSVFLNFRHSTSLGQILKDAQNDLKGQVDSKVLKEIIDKSFTQVKGKNWYKMNSLQFALVVNKYANGTDLQKKQIQKISDYIASSKIYRNRGIEVYPVANGESTGEGSFISINPGSILRKSLITDVNYISSPAYTMDENTIKKISQAIIDKAKDTPDESNIENLVEMSETILSQANFSRSGDSTNTSATVTDTNTGQDITFSEYDAMSGIQRLYKTYSNFIDFVSEFRIDSSNIKVDLDSIEKVNLAKISLNSDGNHTLTIDILTKDGNLQRVENIPLNSVNKVDPKIVSQEVYQQRKDFAKSQIENIEDLKPSEKVILIAQVDGITPSDNMIDAVVNENPDISSLLDQLGKNDPDRRRRQVGMRIKNIIKNDPTLAMLLELAENKNCN